MTARIAALVAVTATITFLAPAAPGAGLRGVADGWLVPPADVAAIWSVQGTAVQPRPAGPGGWLAAGHARLWGMRELPVRELAAGFGGECVGGRLDIGGAWQRTGTRAFAAEGLAAWAGWDGPWGWRMTAARRDPGGGSGPASRPVEWSAEAGPNLRLAGGGALRLRVTLAAGPRLPSTRVPRPLGRCVLVHAGTACVLAWERRPGAGPVPGAELCVAVSRGLALGFRFDAASGSLGPGLAARVQGLMIRSSHVVHPVLGVTHRFQILAGAHRASGPTAVP